MIRVMLAEDQAMVRGALAALLTLEGDIEIVDEVGRGDEVVSAALATKPDVALLDIEMPGLDGISAAAALHKRLPACRVLILTTFGRPSTQLAAAIRRVVAGERVVDPTLAMAALSEGNNPLTERERMVLAAASGGASIAEIASTLFLSEGTVRNYLSVAIQKLGAHNRVEAAHIAEQKGWL